MQRADFVVAIEEGFHMRPAAELTRAARRFQSNVMLQRKECLYNGKSIFSLLEMCAVKGSRISLIIDGTDERAALDSLAALLTELGVRRN